MGLFKKKRKEKSDSENISLPELPDIPEFKRSQSIELPDIPSLPKNKDPNITKREIEENEEYDFKEIRKNFDQRNQKREFGLDEGFETISPKIKSPMTKEIEDGFLQNSESFKIKSRATPAPLIQNSKKHQELPLKKYGTPQQKRDSQGPIFVRVDKYKGAVEKLQNIKQNLMEIEKSLKDIKELKDKEDFELEEWDKEIQSAKSKIEIVDKLLFSQLGD